MQWLGTCQTVGSKDPGSNAAGSRLEFFSDSFIEASSSSKRPALRRKNGVQNMARVASLVVK